MASDAAPRSPAHAGPRIESRSDDGAPARIDGRAARALRTRDAIVNATLTLLETGKLQPTAQGIAALARVSVRAVFHHFGDMDRLLRAAVELHLRRHPFDTLPPLDVSGTLEERVVAFAHRRAATFERILPVHRSVLLKEPADPSVARILARARAGARSELRKAFAPEMHAANDENLIEALMAVTSWCNWEALRVRAGLPFTRAREVLELTLRSLLQRAAPS
jgi:TetR/AcrR family transcriptional regulator, regulator of autoinduction and epiphytic fitness